MLDSSRKKRHRPLDGHAQQHLADSPPHSKRLLYFPDDEAQLNSTHPPISASNSLRLYQDRTSARDSQSSSSIISSVRASSTSVGMTIADFHLEERAMTVRERTKPFHAAYGGKGKGSSDPVCLDSDVSDGNVEVSEVTFERPRIVNSRTSSTDYQAIIGESGSSRYREERQNTESQWMNFKKLQARPGNYEFRHKVGRAHEQPPSFPSKSNTLVQRAARYTANCSSIADETGSLISAEEPIFEGKIPEYANTGFESARCSDVRNKSSTSLHVISRGMKKCESIPEIRSADSSHAQVVQVLEKEVGLRMGEQECSSSGHDSDEDASKDPIIDEENEGVPRASYVLSSGRLSLEQEARLGRRAPTIDRDFEEYFSSLML